MPDVTVEVIVAQQPAIEIPVTETTVIEVAGGVRGPKGDPGAGALAFEWVQATPLSTWTIPVPVGFGRRPLVVLYDAAGNEYDADVLATSSTVTVMHSSPATGSAVLS